MPSSSSPSIARFLSPHYVFNVIIILLYPLFYLWAVETKDVEVVERIVNWNKQAVYMTGLTLTLKLRKFETIDKYVADASENGSKIHGAKKKKNISAVRPPVTRQAFEHQ